MWKTFMRKNVKDEKTIYMLKNTVEDNEQIAISTHIDENSALKQQLQSFKIETERVDLKLKSYEVVSYILDHISPQTN